MSYDQVPFKPSIPLEPFVPHVPDEDIKDLHARLGNEARRARTWDNTNGPHHLGVTHDWITEMVGAWKKFDWRAVEKELGSFPGYHATVEHNGHPYKIHFLALWSKKRDAKPVVFSHGWPGSVLEFVPMLNHVKDEYTPETLPNHILVPSLVGYGFSSHPPLDARFSAFQNACVLDKMMIGLGFGKKGNRGGYYAQGGDIGSFVTRQLSLHESCLGIHLNFLPMGVPKGLTIESLDKVDQSALQRAAKWSEWGQGYRLEHSTKPATIGAVLESSPVALLAWIGEKLEGIQVKDPQRKLHFILSDISLYWYTNTAATCLWEYRAAYGKDKVKEDEYPAHISKPTGYSQFILEIMPTPIPFVKARTNLVYAKRHTEGGHFAALDQPVKIWEDVQGFLEAASNTPSKL